MAYQLITIYNQNHYEHENHESNTAVRTNEITATAYAVDAQEHFTS
ncbi:hypothetical protein QF042_004099 [Pedobacter sp. W3I1]|nr:hypothetical protein [Pedobacter sp. W3I1]MDQ0640534.1 hypothetical protein [Pedobacter sp. W3I1]